MEKINSYQDRTVVVRWTHDPKVGGANPSPGINHKINTLVNNSGKKYFSHHCLFYDTYVGCVFFHRYTKFYTHITHIRNNIHILNKNTSQSFKMNIRGIID